VFKTQEIDAAGQRLTSLHYVKSDGSLELDFYYKNLNCISVLSLSTTRSSNKLETDPSIQNITTKTSISTTGIMSGNTNPSNFANRPKEEVSNIAKKGGEASHNGGFASMDADKQVSLCLYSKTMKPF